MSLFSGIFNLGIGLGTWIGGRVSDFRILPAIGYVGGTLAILGAVYCAFRFVPLLKTKNR
jgi:DHA1 family L-arabinose/isopropyl-beta-D-thiogalactopyranoside export protein-like MFS transporter